MARDANELSERWSRDEDKVMANPESRRPLTGTFSMWDSAESMFEGHSPVVQSNHVLMQVLEGGVILLTDPEGNLEFVTLPTTQAGYACFVRDREG